MRKDKTKSSGVSVGTRKQKGHLGRQIATWIISFIMFSVFTLDMVTLTMCNRLEKQFLPTAETFSKETGDDRIHFLNTGNSDCILLESNGRFALVDAGEGNRNPRRKAEARGYKKEVLSYLKKAAGDKEGKVHLDFALATHCHYDHIGNFEAILADESITIGRMYLKPYDTETATELEQTAWGNHATYDAVIQGLKKRGVPLISDLPDWEFRFGDFKIRFINTVTPASLHGKGENSASVGVWLQKGTQTAFLAADFTKKSGLEAVYAEDIGEVTLLKIGHHGYLGSSSQSFLGVLKPKIAICTNYLGKIYPNVKWNLAMVARVPVYATPENGGLIATFTDADTILLTNHIM